MFVKFRDDEAEVELIRSWFNNIEIKPSFMSKGYHHGSYDATIRVDAKLTDEQFLLFNLTFSTVNSNAGCTEIPIFCCYTEEKSEYDDKNNGGECYFQYCVYHSKNEPLCGK